MPRPYLLLLLLLPAGPPLHAQTEYYARVGAVGASTLVHDALIDEVKVRQSIAPMVAIGGSLPIGPGYRAGLEATFASGGFKVEEGGSEGDLGTLRTGSLMGSLEGPIHGPLRWRAGLGALLYWPAEDAGIFQQGGTTRFLAGAGADYRRPVLPAWDLMASLRYDFHRFSTSELEARGFSSTQAVSRLSLSVGLSRSTR